MHNLDAGVAHQNVDAAEGGINRGYAVNHAPLERDVHAHAHGLTALRSNEVSRGHRILSRDIRDGHACTLAREQERNCLADSAAGTGNETPSYP